MSTPPIDPGSPRNPGPGSVDLEAALRDLGAHLDLGPGATDEAQTALVATVLERLDDATSPDPGAADRPVAAFPASALPEPAPIDRLADRRRLLRRVLAAAAVVVVVLAGLLAITPTRDAVARWLGIGAVSVTGSTADQAPPDGDDPAPGAPTRGGDTAAPGAPDLDAIREAVPFPVRLADPALTGELLDAEADPSVPVGLVELRYDGVTIVQIGSREDAPPVVGKVAGPETVATPVTVAGSPGLWLTGAPHQVASMDPDGEVRLDTVRRAGDVLIWEDDGVTYRIEGARSLDAAQAIATSLR